MMTFEKVPYAAGMKSLPEKPFLDEMIGFFRDGEMPDNELYYLTCHVEITAKDGEPFALFGNPDAAMVTHGEMYSGETGGDYTNFGKLAMFLARMMKESLKSVTDPEIRGMIQKMLDDYREHGVTGMQGEQILTPGTGDIPAGTTLYAVGDLDGKVHSYKVTDVIGSILELERIGCPGDTMYVNREKAFRTEAEAQEEWGNLYGETWSKCCGEIKSAEDLAAFLYQYAKPYLKEHGLFGELQAADKMAVELGVSRW